VRGLCLALWLLAGCPKRDLTRTDPIPALLQQADAAWERRGEDGFGPVEDLLFQAWGIRESDPEVLWRLVRLKIGQGLAQDDPVAARYEFAEARALGIQCLDGDAAFRQQRTEVSWAGAVERIGVEREDCAAWTALAWARWLEVHGGAAGALDLEPLDDLLRVQDGDGPEGVGAWAGGLLAAVRPTWAGQDLERARRQLERAVQQEPRALVRRIDLFLLVQAPTMTEERDAARLQLKGRPADTPEDRAAVRRLDQAWEGGVAPPTRTQ
jgi:hypothetical protein